MFRKLTRTRQQLSHEECIDILKREPRGILSVMGDNGYPYGMPMNHWYCEDNGRIYFHSGKNGHKTDALKANDKVSFCVLDKGFRKDGHWSLNIKSVIVFGRIRFIEDIDRVCDISRNLSYKFTSDIDYIETEIKTSAQKTLCLELIPEYIAGKLVNEA